MVAYKLPNIAFQNRGYDLDNSFSGRIYSSSKLIQEKSRINGYSILEIESLPYLGSLESQTNKTVDKI